MHQPNSQMYTPNLSHLTSVEFHFYKLAVFAHMLNMNMLKSCDIFLEQVVKTNA